jgi:hypothetical protein
MKFTLPAILVLAALLLLSPPVEAKNIFKAGRDIIVEHEQQVNNVVSIGGQITVSGLVEQNVLAIGGSVVLTNNAVVRGNVIVVGGVVARGSGALVFGDITEINSATLSEAFTSAMRGELSGWSLILDVISLCFLAIILIIALFITLLTPRALTAITETIEEHTVKSFFWGFLTTLLIVPFFMLLAVSIIGIFLIPVTFTVLILASIIGFIAVGSLVGNFVIARLFRNATKSLVKETMLGLSLLWLLGWAPFYIGMVVKVLAITFGLGGFVLALSRLKPHFHKLQIHHPQ